MFEFLVYILYNDRFFTVSYIITIYKVTSYNVYLTERIFLADFKNEIFFAMKCKLQLILPTAVPDTLLCSAAEGYVLQLDMFLCRVKIMWEHLVPPTPIRLNFKSGGRYLNDIM